MKSQHCILRSALGALMIVFPSCLAIDSMLIGQEIKFVSPREFANKEGDDSPNLTECCPFSFRYQQLFPATDFSSLPDGKGWLISIAWRPDGEAVTAPRSISLGNMVLRLSTTNNTVLVDDFSSNVTSSFTTVLDSEVLLETSNLGPLGGPKEFDYVIKFDKPFLYDSAEGNLLFDWDVTEGFPAPAHLSDGYSGVFDAAMGSVRFGIPVDNPTGYFVGGFVQEFTFVPEPSSHVSLCLALASVSIMRRRKR